MGGSALGQAGGLEPEHGDREGGRSGRRAQEAQACRPGGGHLRILSRLRIPGSAGAAGLPWGCRVGGAPGGGWERTGPFSDHDRCPLATRPGALRYTKNLCSLRIGACSKFDIEHLCQGPKGPRRGRGRGPVYGNEASSRTARLQGA
jgi:hypothetical protein